MLIPHEHWNLRQLGAAWREGGLLSNCLPNRREVSLPVQWEVGDLRQRDGNRTSRRAGAPRHCSGEPGQGAWHGRVRDNHLLLPWLQQGVIIPLLSAACGAFLTKSCSGSALIVSGAEGMGQSPLQQELESIPLSKNVSYSKYPSQRQWELFCLLIWLIKPFPATDIVPVGHGSTKSTGWDPKRSVWLLHHVPEALKSVS